MSTEHLLLELEQLDHQAGQRLVGKYPQFRVKDVSSVCMETKHAWRLDPLVSPHARPITSSHQDVVGEVVDARQRAGLHRRRFWDCRRMARSLRVRAQVDQMGRACRALRGALWDLQDREVQGSP
ncbi:hypothetical protein EYF80_008454 [Liparis tanakae]|uniref:Uncharacterized protein n=1 Tax=Liparis tanakae TaxID=230148 RepID=A0A4Z2IUZ5_9TELE|nr:hypothetical protein EYF80_008454 [Liparis tanakae]